MLVQKGTLQQGDIVVAGAEWGRVRAMLDDKGRALIGEPDRPRRWRFSACAACRPPASRSWWWRTKAARARSPNSASGGSARRRPARAVGARGTLDQMLARIQAGEQKEVAVLIKADVQGSAEAIQATVLKLAHEEVKVRVLHAARRADHRKRHAACQGVRAR